jgi:hypothetical protein
MKLHQASASARIDCIGAVFNIRSGIEYLKKLPKARSVACQLIGKCYDLLQASNDDSRKGNKGDNLPNRNEGLRVQPNAQHNDAENADGGCRAGKHCYHGPP